MNCLACGLLYNSSATSKLSELLNWLINVLLLIYWSIIRTITSTSYTVVYYQTLTTLNDKHLDFEKTLQYFPMEYPYLKSTK